MSEYKCPHCDNELVQDPNNENKLLCYHCKKRYDHNQIMRFVDNQRQSNSIHTQVTTSNVQGSHYEEQQNIFNDISPSGTPKKLPVGFAIVSFILGLLGLVGMLVPFVDIIFVVTGVIGIILGSINIGRGIRGRARGKGLAITGIILNSIAVIVSLIVMAVIVYASFTNGDIGSAVDTSSDPLSSIANKIQPKAENEYWNDGVINVNGKAIKLGESTVQDFVDTGIIDEKTIWKNNKTGECSTNHPQNYDYMNPKYIDDPEYLEVPFTEWVGDDVRGYGNKTSKPINSISNTSFSFNTSDEKISISIGYDESDDLIIGERPITSISVSVKSDWQRVFNDDRFIFSDSIKIGSSHEDVVSAYGTAKNDTTIEDKDNNLEALTSSVRTASMSYYSLSENGNMEILLLDGYVYSISLKK